LQCSEQNNFLGSNVVSTRFSLDDVIWTNLFKTVVVVYEFSKSLMELNKISRELKWSGFTFIYWRWIPLEIFGSWVNLLDKCELLRTPYYFKTRKIK
jgi:hypothetical protein